METLLRLMLVHYYQDSKRSTNATITRALDNQIRDISGRTSGLQKLVSDCRKEAEAAKRQARTKFRKRHKNHTIRGNPGVQHIPCRGRRG